MHQTITKHNFLAGTFAEKATCVLSEHVAASYIQVICYFLNKFWYVKCYFYTVSPTNILAPGYADEYIQMTCHHWLIQTWVTEIKLHQPNFGLGNVSPPPCFFFMNQPFIPGPCLLLTHPRNLLLLSERSQATYRTPVCFYTVHNFRNCSFFWNSSAGGPLCPHKQWKVCNFNL